MGRPASPLLMVAGLAAGGNPLRAPCNRPPLRASRCKRVCSRAATTLAGCCPYERRWPPLRAVTPASGIGLPCGLALAPAGRPLARGLGRGLAMGGRAWGLAVAGRPSSSLPSL
ncbi:hypothetical protein BHM03_00059541 [Ensete ventricosum]|nr:hypothetical protein BHM03_00059541 [Ensete ventricosum]